MRPIIGVAVALAGLIALQHSLILLGLACIAAVVLLARMGTRTVTVHSGPGDRAAAAVHEAGHLAVGRHVGGDAVYAQIWSDGSGIAKVRTYDDLSAIAVALGGAAAEGSDHGAGHDFRTVDRILANLPVDQRDQMSAAAQREVQRALKSRAREVTRDAEVLELRGWV